MFIFFKIKKFKFLFPTQFFADGEHGSDLPVHGTGEEDGWALCFLLTSCSDGEHSPCGLSLPSQYSPDRVVNSRVLSIIHPLLLHKHTAAQLLQLSALGFPHTLLYQWRNSVSFSALNISQLHLDSQPEHFSTPFGFPERQTNGANYFKTCINNPAGWA